METPNGLTAIATILAAFATLCAVLVALFGMRYERIRAQEDRKDAQAKFLEAQYATNRPLLIPLELYVHNTPGIIDWDAAQFIKIHNGGTGIATNVWGVLMPPASVLSISNQHHIQFWIPLRPGVDSSEDIIGTLFTRGGTLFSCDDKIGEYTLCIPEIQKGRGDRTARLTLTYSDIFGRRHASIFDYTNTGNWVQVDILTNIQQRLDEIDQAKRIKLSEDITKPSSLDINDSV